MRSGNLNFLEPSGPPQACNGTAFHLSYNALKVFVVWFSPSVGFICFSTITWSIHRLTFFTVSIEAALPFLLASFYFCHSVISGWLCNRSFFRLFCRVAYHMRLIMVFCKFVLRGIFTINLFIIINFLFTQVFLVFLLLFSGQESLSV
jgi:hypothetical protein